jgi:hypothetical protein
MKTWIELQQGKLPLASTPPHIIDCLGWTKQQLDRLRDRDFNKHRAEKALLARLEQQVQQKTAVILPTPTERLPPQQLEQLVKPGQTMIVPWRVDLSALARYGYSESEIAVFQQRMYRLAESRMAGL